MALSDVVVIEVGVQGPAGPTSGDMMKSTYDTNDNGIVDRANEADNARAGSTLEAQIAAKIPLTQKGAADGVCELDSSLKVPASRLPASVVGAMTYVSGWNAATNSPAIPAASSGNKGYYYKVTTAGATNISGITDWKVNDVIVSNGTTWDKFDHSDQVASVAGRQGDVVIGIADVTGLQTALDNVMVQAAFLAEVFS